MLVIPQHLGNSGKKIAGLPSCWIVSEAHTQENVYAHIPQSQYSRSRPFTCSACSTSFLSETLWGVAVTPVHILRVRIQALEPDCVPIVSWELTETKIEYSSDLWTEKYFFLKQGWLERDDSMVKDIFCSSRGPVFSSQYSCQTAPSHLWLKLQGIWYLWLHRVWSVLVHSCTHTHVQTDTPTRN